MRCFCCYFNFCNWNYLCKSLDLSIAAYCHTESNEKLALSNAGSNLPGIITMPPEVQTIWGCQNLSTDNETSKHIVNPKNEPNHIGITYEKNGVYTCRVCNALSCIDENITISVLGRRLRIEIRINVFLHTYGCSSCEMVGYYLQPLQKANALVLKLYIKQTLENTGHEWIQEHRRTCMFLLHNERI